MRCRVKGAEEKGETEEVCFDTHFLLRSHYIIQSFL